MQKQKKIIFVAAVILCALVALGATYLTSSQKKLTAVAETVTGLPAAEVVIKTARGDTHTFMLEVAKDAVDIQIGLMYRKHMPDDHGMIFLMGKPAKEVSFWMKNTMIPLDMLFVDETGRIAHIHPNAIPQDLTPIPSRMPVVAVIELNGGLAEKRGISVGDEVIYAYFSK